MSENPRLLGYQSPLGKWMTISAHLGLYLNLICKASNRSLMIRTSRRNPDPESHSQIQLGGWLWKGVFQRERGNLQAGEAVLNKVASEFSCSLWAGQGARLNTPNAFDGSINQYEKLHHILGFIFYWHVLKCCGVDYFRTIFMFIIAVIMWEGVVCMWYMKVAFFILYTYKGDEDVWTL